CGAESCLHMLAPECRERLDQVMPGVPVRRLAKVGRRHAHPLSEGARKRFRSFVTARQRDLHDRQIAIGELLRRTSQAIGLYILVDSHTEQFGELSLEMPLRVHRNATQTLHIEGFVEVRFDMSEHTSETGEIAVAVIIQARVSWQPAKYPGHQQ